MEEEEGRLTLKQRASLSRVAAQSAAQVVPLIRNGKKLEAPVYAWGRSDDADEFDGRMYDTADGAKSTGINGRTDREIVFDDFDDADANGFGTDATHLSVPEARGGFLYARASGDDADERGPEEFGFGQPTYDNMPEGDQLVYADTTNLTGKERRQTVFGDTVDESGQPLYAMATNTEEARRAGKGRQQIPLERRGTVFEEQEDESDDRTATGPKSTGANGRAGKRRQQQHPSKKEDDHRTPLAETSFGWQGDVSPSADATILQKGRHPVVVVSPTNGDAIYAIPIDPDSDYDAIASLPGQSSGEGNEYLLPTPLPLSGNLSDGSPYALVFSQGDRHYYHQVSHESEDQTYLVPTPLPSGQQSEYGTSQGVFLPAKESGMAMNPLFKREGTVSGRSMDTAYLDVAPDDLQQHRNDLMTLEDGKIPSWAIINNRWVPSVINWVMPKKRIKKSSTSGSELYETTDNAPSSNSGGAFPFTHSNVRITEEFFSHFDQVSIRRYHRIRGALEEAGHALVTVAYITTTGIMVYMLTQGGGNPLKIFIGGYVQANFAAQQALWGAFFGYPIVQGVRGSRAREQLSTLSDPSAISDRLASFLPKKSDDAWDNGTYALGTDPIPIPTPAQHPSTLYNDFWRLPKALHNLGHVLSDNRLEQEKALQLLEQVYSLTQHHTGRAWRHAVRILRDVAIGSSSAKIANPNDLTRRAQALAYLRQILKDSPSSSFKGLYIRYILKEMGIHTSKTQRALGTLAKTVKFAAHGLMLEGAINGLRGLTSPPKKDPDPTGAPSVEGGNATTIAPPPVDTTGAPPPPPPGNDTTIAPSPPPEDTTGAPPPPPPGNDTTIAPPPPPEDTTAAPPPPPPPPISPAASLQCLAAISSTLGIFSGQEDPHQNVLPKIAKLPNLSGQRAQFTFRGQGLSIRTVINFFTGLSAVQPGLIVDSVVLDSLVYDQQTLDELLGVLPRTLRTLRWDLDQYAVQFNLSPPTPPSGGFNLTRVGQLENLSSISFSGWWNLINFGTVPVTTLSNLQNIDMSLTGLGQNAQTGPFLRAVFNSTAQTIRLNNNTIGINPADTGALADAISSRQSSGYVTKELDVSGNDLGYNTPIGSLSLLQSFGTMIGTTKLLFNNNVIGQAPAPSGTSYIDTLTSSLNALSDLESFGFQGTYLSRDSGNFTAFATAIFRREKLRAFYGVRPAKLAPSYPDNFVRLLRTLLPSLNETDVHAWVLPSDVSARFPHGTTNLSLPYKIGTTSDVLQALATAITNSSDSIRYVDLSNINDLTPSATNPQTNFSTILGPAIERVQPEALFIANNQINGQENQDFWFRAIGPRTKQVNFGGNYFGGPGYRNITLLVVGLNNTLSLDSFSLSQNPYIESAGLNAIGAAFRSRGNLTNLSADRCNAGTGNLTVFWAGVGAQKFLRRFNIAYNPIVDGVGLADALRGLPLQYFDASYLTLDRPSSDAIVSTVMDLLSRGYLQEGFKIGGMNSSEAVLQEFEPQITNYTNTHTRTICGQALFDIITNSTSSGNGRRSLTFMDERPLDALSPQELRRGPYYDKDGNPLPTFVRPHEEPAELYDEHGNALFATNGASGLEPPLPFIVIASLFRRAINLLQAKPALEPAWAEDLSLPAEAILKDEVALPSNDTQHMPLATEPSDHELSQKDPSSSFEPVLRDEVLLPLNGTQSISLFTAPLEKEKAVDSPYDSSSNSTASSFLPTPDELQSFSLPLHRATQEDLPSSSQFSLRDASDPAPVPSARFSSIVLDTCPISSENTTRTDFSSAPRIAHNSCVVQPRQSLSFWERVGKVLESPIRAPIGTVINFAPPPTPAQIFMNQTENGATSVLFLFAIFQHLSDVWKSTPHPDMMRDFYETYVPVNTHVQKDLARRLTETRHHLWVLDHASFAGLGRISPTYNDQLEDLERDFSALFSNEKGVGAGRLKTLQKDLDTLYGYLQETSYGLYSQLPKDQKDALALRHFIHHFSDALEGLNNQNRLDRKTFASGQRLIETFNKQLRRFAQTSDLEERQRILDDLKEKRERMTYNLKEKYDVKTPRVNLQHIHQAKFRKKLARQEYEENLQAQYLQELFG